VNRVVTREQIRSAWVIAIVADLVQLAVFPAVIAGAASPFEAPLDILVGALLIWRLGWHWAFLPTFIAELLPGFDLVPTWTVAVWVATRGMRRPAEPQLPPDAR
jgi:hypothetical protein